MVGPIITPPDDPITRAAAAADALFEDPRLIPDFEPADPGAARAAIEQFGARFAALPGVATVAMENARAGAQVLSGDRFQGLAEIIQNADDAGASRVRFMLAKDALVAAHDGHPVTLRNVLGLATPWLTSKSDDPTATGRFGIGLMTLQALSRTLEVHCGPYHFRVGEPTVKWVDQSNVPVGFAAAGETVLLVPLTPGVMDQADLDRWAARWDSSALLFCRHVAQVETLTGSQAGGLLRLTWEERGQAPVHLQRGPMMIRRRRAQAPDGRTWAVFAIEASSPANVARANKAIGSTTPVGVALAENHDDSGQIYAGLPVITTSVPVRINAQFDPVTSRQGLALTPWNAALLPLAADVWTAAVLDLFHNEPGAAWRVVPLPTGDEVEPRGTLVDLEALLLARARQVLPGSLTFAVDGAQIALVDLAVEVPPLTGLLSEVEIAGLAGLRATLPGHARDEGGRWREVLGDWRNAGAALPNPVSVEMALPLIGDETRPAAATVALTGAALESNLGTRLTDIACVVTDDGGHVRPPPPFAPTMLVRTPVGLASQLGIAHRLHDAHLADGKDAVAVLAWLQASGAIVDTADESSVLRRLAAAGEAGNQLAAVLTDGQANALRDAFERLPTADRAGLGPGVGKAVKLGAYHFDRRSRKVAITARPIDAYLPRSIDKDPDGFAAAAANTPGLVWLDGRYGDVLRSPLGRHGLGAQRFLRLLGAETAPRLLSHPELFHRYPADSRRGLSIGCPDSPPGRDQALRGMTATYTLEDQYSPDLAAVLVDIGRDRKPTRRRKRATSILASLGRAWDRLAEAAEVTAAADYYGWIEKGSSRAFWVWQVAATQWLDDDTGTPRPPIQLRLRTPGTVAVHGAAAAGYLHAALSAERHDLLSEFGVTGEPSTGDLVERLRLLRDSQSGDASTMAAEAAVVYQAISDRLAGHKRVAGDLPANQLRHSFSQAQGLLLTSLGWRTPAQVFLGPPVFGDHRAFAPQIPGTGRLWSALHLRTPSAEDCASVLAAIARARRTPDTGETPVLLETLRLLAERLAASPAEKVLARRLARLALWTSKGWSRERPVYAVDDPTLADELGVQVPIWRPGGELTQFRNLLSPLRITELASGATKIVDPESAHPDEEATTLLQAAVPLLREDLIRNDPLTESSLEIAWSQLADFQVRIAANLRVLVDGLAEGRSTIVPVTAKADPDARVLYLAEPAVLSRADAGGRAIAALFAADSRRVAQAWLAACDYARVGREAHHLELARHRATEEEARSAADIAARIATFRDETAAKHSRTSRLGTQSSPVSVSGDGRTAASAPNAAEGAVPALTPIRQLVDPAKLRVTDPRGRLAGTSGGRQGGSEGFGKGFKPRHDLPAPRPGGATPQGGVEPRPYTPLSKESVGLDLVRKVLASDAREMMDLRAQHGVGADAVDTLERFFELKVYIGAEPDRITLEESQIRRAMSTPDFFLVVVSGVEGPNATPKVRVILDPLTQLKLTETSSVSFTGVHQSQSIVYDLVPA